MRRTAAALLLAGYLLPASADPLPADPLQRRCWLSRTAERTAADLREPVAVRFGNLKSGYALRSPFWVEFGVRGMGVIPAGNKNDKAGHHHILIDTPLPGDPQAQIPFSATHKHFGKGQTGTELDLPPGQHRLRLLFADHEHRPYFVYSPEITITVTGRRNGAGPQIDEDDFDASCAAWYQDAVSAPRVGGSAVRQVYVKNIRDGEPVASPFVLSLGTVGWGVAPAGAKVKDAGHFSLQIRGPGGRKLTLADGRTETLLDLPRGDYEIELSLLDSDGALLQKMGSGPLRFSVTRQER